MELPLSMEILAAIAVATNRFVEMFVKPIYEKYNFDKFSLPYVAWAVAGFLVALAKLAPAEWLSMALVVMLVGGGSNLIADLFKAKA